MVLVKHQNIKLSEHPFRYYLLHVHGSRYKLYSNCAFCVAGPRSPSRLEDDSEKFQTLRYSQGRFADGCLENGSLHIKQPFAIERKLIG